MISVSRLLINVSGLCSCLGDTVLFIDCPVDCVDG